MTRAQVRDFEAADLAAAGALAAARFARLRAAEPRLAPHASDTEACRASLRELLERPHAAGAVATWAGEPIGFMLAQRNVAALDSPQSYFNPPYSAGVALGAHACAAAEELAEVYGAMYAHLSQRWVAEGFLDHSLAVLGCESEVAEVFSSFGFGRAFALALRGLEPLSEPTRSDLEIREAGDKERDDVLALSAQLRAFHSGAPMFLPNPLVLRSGQQGLMRWVAKQPGCPAFIAYRDGEPVGLAMFAPAGFVDEPFRADGIAYLWQGVVAPGERGGGVGAALLQHALTELRRAGASGCALHFLTGNPSGAPFWKRHGFRVADYTLRRIVDSRIAWSVS